MRRPHSVSVILDFLLENFYSLDDRLDEVRSKFRESHKNTCGAFCLSILFDDVAKADLLLPLYLEMISGKLPPGHLPPVSWARVRVRVGVELEPGGRI